ncbi:MAG TPA: M23 family metallopeptidase [Xanthomonadaceae bacterium]|nr:M23 family metallopeptidase [Xanthomonadaceae bacterium]
MRARLALAILAFALLPPPAGAAHVYRWTDHAGVVHYGDRAPDAAKVQARDLRVIPVRAEPGAVVRLRVEGDGSGNYAAWADNTLAGPLEVMLRFSRGSNVAGDPALPADAVVPARGSVRVARIGAVDPARAGEFELQLDAMPGDPSARPRDVVYQLPLRQRASRIDQGYGGRFSHTDPQNLYAVDFAADIGTPVLAARDGVVMQVESDFDKAGLNMEKYGGRANFVRILHDDGTMGLYAHLQEGGALVRLGQRVRAGQQIGLSGNTGFTTGPHLHFAVQVNRGMRLQALPFRMAGPAGPLSIPGVAAR